MMERGVRAVEEGDVYKRKEKHHEFTGRKIEIERISVYQKKHIKKWVVLSERTTR